MSRGETGESRDGRKLLRDFIKLPPPVDVREVSRRRDADGDLPEPGPLKSQIVQLAADAEYDYYKAMVQRNNGIFEAEAGKKNLVSVRHETSTYANDGKGVYDDTAVLLWVDGDGTKHVSRYRANTDPTAKYLNDKDATEDVNNDKLRELGRLPAGSYYLEHRWDRKKSSTVGDGNVFGMPAGAEAQAEYDTDRDGLFYENAWGKGGESMFWHSGRTGDVASAGCQTMHPDDWARFVEDMDASAVDAYNPFTDPISLRYTLINEDTAKGNVPYQSRAAGPVSLDLYNGGASSVQDWILNRAVESLGRIGEVFTGNRLAAGGDVKGPGSSIGDKIPAYLSDGEFVMNARSTTVNRPFLQALNADPFFLQKMLEQRSAQSSRGQGYTQGAPSGQPGTVNISMSSQDDVVARLKVLAQQWELMHAS
ncbi:hypothetical protein ACGFQG_15005 [Nocardia fluminea]|uniref:hypothetical protein n=1 Tax=Nocardia fluminea TaxID=134984 RepID=UPI003400B6A2